MKKNNLKKNQKQCSILETLLESFILILNTGK